MRIYFFCLLGSFFLLAGCTRTRCVDDQCVSSLVKNRIDQEVYWGYNKKIKCKIQQLLKQDLSVEAAVQVALLQNPEIQATFEELGIAHADLIEAGLFSNPIFDFTARFPNQGGLKTDIEYSITASFLDLFLIPLRKKVAEAKLEEALFRVSNAILNLSFDVQEVYYKLQAAQTELQYSESIAEIAAIQMEIAQRQLNANNIFKLDAEIRQANVLEANLEVDRLQAEVIHLKEKLHRLMGLCAGEEWSIQNTVTDVACQDSSVECLETIAFRERLDLQEARWKVIRISRMLGLQQWWVYTEGRLGISSEVEPEGFTVLGPAISGAIPIFNYGQAARLRLCAELRQAKDQLAALEIQVLSQVQETYKRWKRYLLSVKKYQEELLPLEMHILDDAERLYNVMGLGIDRLLENKKNQLEMYKSYMLTLRNYWIERVNLDRSLGRKR